MKHLHVCMYSQPCTVYVQSAMCNSHVPSMCNSHVSYTVYVQQPCIIYSVCTTAMYHIQCMYNSHVSYTVYVQQPCIIYSVCTTAICTTAISCAHKPHTCNVSHLLDIAHNHLTEVSRLVKMIEQQWQQG